MNNVLTASRMSSALSCLRRHFWSYEIGLRKPTDFIWLKVGSAWARAMEARWHGKDYESCLAYAIPAGIDMDGYSCATVAALLAGYFDYYGDKEDFAQINPEVQFDYDIGDGFTAEGKLDGLGTLQDGRSGIIESKTTSESLDPDSDYWLRLAFNMQVYQYVHAARHYGWEVDTVIYDVTRKPAIRPKEVYDLDSTGRKIVIDANGRRVFKTKKVKGKEVEDKTSPRLSGDESKGWAVKSHMESPDEFSDRLWRDCQKRPSFYYCRREVPIIDDVLESFVKQRKAIGRMIQGLRENEIPDGQPSDEYFPRDPEAWPRHVSTDTCNFCAYKSFCLQNISVDLAHPPEGFSITPFNPELEQQYETTEQINDAATSG